MAPDLKDPQALLEAFAAFTAASEQLQTKYDGLQEQLRRIQDELQAVLEAAPIAIWVLGEKGEVRFSNRPKGMDGTFLDGALPWKLASPKGLRRFRDAAGRELFFEQEARPTSAGQIVTLRDVTEEHLRSQQDTREQRLQAMGAMAAELAHEIRNPLGSLALFAGMLVQDLAEQPGPLELAQRTQEGVQRLNTLVTNALTFSRDLQPKPQALPLRALWEDARRSIAMTDTVAWVNDVPAGAAWLADPDLLRQVAVNLVQNAVRAVEDAAAPELKLAAARETVDGRAQWHLTLTDNGPGIPPQDMARIFDPFYSTFRGGTGLGLAVCHRILVAHEGLLFIESTGEGTTVHIRLGAAPS